jgi:hypothetical protein
LTSQGHPYARFRRALDRGNLLAAWAAATELAQVSLADALVLCLLILEHEPQRYSAAATRWLGRYCCEERAVNVDEAALVAAHLTAIRGEAAAVEALRELLEARGRDEIAAALRRWSESSERRETQGKEG